jgi:hypothetical protein
MLLLMLLVACSEDKRFEIYSDDKVPPGVPTYDSLKALYGGVRIYFRAPADADVLSVNAEYVSAAGKLYTFSASYFSDSLDVLGLGSTDPQVITMYALDRAGNRSANVPVEVVPLEPVVQRVEKTVKVVAGFSSFYVDWYNEILQTVNVYVNFNYRSEEHLLIYTSLDSLNREFVSDLDLGPEEPIKVSVRIEDRYGNTTGNIDKGTIYLLSDELIPKTAWTIPDTNDSIAGVPMCYGNAKEGRVRYIFDDVIDSYKLANYMHTDSKGRTGGAGGNVPWNFLIDLGDYYELSRIITHQRHGTAGDLNPMARGQYYGSENVGRYALYYLDEELGEWVWMSEHKIPVPNVNDMDMFRYGQAGDMAYMFPDAPKFSPKTRWFRYEALNSFSENYTGTGCNCLSEITLYGKKANP